jgi:hypothetical protein
MNTIDRLSDRSLALVHRTRDGLDAVSTHLPQWLSAGAALSLARSGTRVATTLVRRNPAAAVAVGVLGVGVLAYRMYRKRANASDATTADDGATVDVAAKNKSREVRPARKRTQRKTTASKAARAED